MQSLSAVISAFNEEVRIRRCLNSVSWADEIILVDNQSSDRTSEIAKSFGARIFVRKNNPMLNQNKNFGFSKAAGDWIINLDADEELTNEVAAEIRRTISGETEIDGYWIKRKNIIFGKWIRHGLWWPDKQLRLFKRGKGAFPCVHVHEYVSVEGRTAELSFPFIHHNYDSISQYLRKMNLIYTENETSRHLDAKYQLAWWDAIRFPVSDFVKIYFAQEGYRDGLHGLVLSLLQSFYSFIVFAKLWEKKNFVEVDIDYNAAIKEISNNIRDIEYWMRSVEIKNTDNLTRRFWLKLRRKIGYF